MFRNANSPHFSWHAFNKVKLTKHTPKFTTSTEHLHKNTLKRLNVGKEKIIFSLDDADTSLSSHLILCTVKLNAFSGQQNVDKFNHCLSLLFSNPKTVTNCDRIYMKRNPPTIVRINTSLCSHPIQKSNGEYG